MLIFSFFIIFQGSPTLEVFYHPPTLNGLQTVTICYLTELR